MASGPNVLLTGNRATLPAGRAARRQAASMRARSWATRADIESSILIEDNSVQNPHDNRTDVFDGGRIGGGADVCAGRHGSGAHVCAGRNGKRRNACEASATGRVAAALATVV